MSGSTLIVCLVLSAWFVAAALAGREGWLAALPRPLIPCISLGMAALSLLAARAVPGVRRLIGSFPLRLLIGLHSVRVLGVAFFVVHAKMQIPGVFALPAGGCEVIVAMSALAIAFAPLRPSQRWRLARLWNYAGLAGLSAMVTGALILAFGEPARSMALARPPLSLILTFVLPLGFTTHLLMTRRLRTIETAAENSTTQ